ncbi:MAG: hypothetical protein Q7S20_02100 [Gemmatimonadaceae bacterium]|nr:hypothetical protein [Gemmatimonadaceae bacterium]
MSKRKALWPLDLVTSDVVDRARFDQLVNGVSAGQSLLLMSASP